MTRNIDIKGPREVNPSEQQIARVWRVYFVAIARDKALPGSSRGTGEPRGTGHTCTERQAETCKKSH